MLSNLSQSSEVYATREAEGTRTISPPHYTSSIRVSISCRNDSNEDAPGASVELDGLLHLLDGGRLRRRLLAATHGCERSGACCEKRAERKVLVLDGATKDNAVSTVAWVCASYVQGAMCVVTSKDGG
jgi:hypothetical protein